MGNSVNRKIGIIGGGAAGMTAAIVAAGQGAEVVLFEKGERLGRKILATGNGKCNLGNLELSPEMYYSESPEKIPGWLEEFSTQDTISFFEGLGLMIKQKNGYLYPMSEQAATVLDVLRFQIARERRIQVKLQSPVIHMERRKKQEKILVKTETEEALFDRVILTCGGKAARATGSDGSGYKLAGMLGHRIVPVVPALVQLRCREEWCKSIAGVRAEARLTFLNAAGEKEAERGELQLTEYGISGLPVFQLSRKINYLLRGQKEVSVDIDFLPGEPEERFAEKMLEKRAVLEKGSTLEEYFTGVLHKKLMLLLIGLAGKKPSDRTDAVSEDTLKKIYSFCRKLTVTVYASNPFENAQVCAGGVSLLEVTERLESRLCPGVFLAGEILDVDGRCGGYNLHWAWCSGHIAASAAAE